MDCSSNIIYGRAVVNWKLQPRALNFYHSVPLQICLSNLRTTQWKIFAHGENSELAVWILRVNKGGAMPYKAKECYTVKYEVEVNDDINKKCLKLKQGKVHIHRGNYFEEILKNLISFNDCSDWPTIIVRLEIIESDIDISTTLNSTLSSYYEKMFNNPTFSDFQVITPDGKEVYVHKNILSIRSPVFEAMIRSKMIEGSEKKVRIDDIKGRALTELIRFIYSGNVNEIDTIAGELLYAANKYDLQDLKPLCVESLAFNIAVDNALESLILADLHQEKYLKKFAMDFIKIKYSEIKEQPEWKNLSHQLMKDILDFIMSPSEHMCKEHNYLD